MSFTTPHFSLSYIPYFLPFPQSHSHTLVTGRLWGNCCDWTKTAFPITPNHTGGSCLDGLQRSCIHNWVYWRNCWAAKQVLKNHPSTSQCPKTNLIFLTTSPQASRRHWPLIVFFSFLRGAYLWSERKRRRLLFGLTNRKSIDYVDKDCCDCPYPRNFCPYSREKKSLGWGATDAFLDVSRPFFMGLKLFQPYSWPFSSQPARLLNRPDWPSKMSQRHTFRFVRLPCPSATPSNLHPQSHMVQKDTAANAVNQSKNTIFAAL